MSDPLNSNEAIESLYALYAHDIFRYARLSLGNDSDAYDAVQEVFFRAFRSWQSFRHDSNAKTWLLSIARNYVYDTYRKRKAERNQRTRAELPDVADRSIPIEDMLTMEDALDQLKETYREVLVLRFVERLSVQETAEVLGWSVSKVSITAHRAIDKLREILEPHQKGGTHQDDF